MAYQALKHRLPQPVSIPCRLATVIHRPVALDAEEEPARPGRFLHDPRVHRGLDPILRQEVHRRREQVLAVRVHGSVDAANPAGLWWVAPGGTATGLTAVSATNMFSR